MVAHLDRLKLKRVAELLDGLCEQEAAYVSRPLAHHQVLVDRFNLAAVVLVEL